MKFTHMLMYLVLLLTPNISIFAQEQMVSGIVTDSSGMPLPGANVLVKGSTRGVQTDFDGNYSIEVAQGEVLVFSFIGMQTKELTVGMNTDWNVILQPDAAQLKEVVITALGIKREKKSLGYATQEVDGSEVSDVPTANFMNSLSGKVAGLKIKSSGTMGGSTDIVIRGNSSLTGNNQALFVIDGTPIGNAINNTSDQRAGRGGYDYGNAAADINPDDIASMNILKGAAATALYGARAANGVIIIETKKGREGKGIGVTINSSLMVSEVDDSTLPIYQDQYGAGYGPYYASADGYFSLYDLDGDGDNELTTPFTEDASFGAKFDPSRMIYQWNSIYPQLEDTYLQATPWVAGEHTPNDFWEKGITAVNSIGLDGATDKSTFRLGFTNFNTEGNLPNSLIKRNTLVFNATHDLTEDFEAGAMVTYAKTDGKGRYGTGYDSMNPMQPFRQWWQTNVDLYAQRDAYFKTRENITWNPNGPHDLSPIYADNPYWTRYENFQTDTRNRYFGNVNLNYEISDVFSAIARFSFDTYDELQEERINVGSADVSKYSRFNNSFSEYNYDLILNFDKDFTENINLEGLIGFNLRRNDNRSIRASTNGGLNAPGFYALSNSAAPIEPPVEYDATEMVDGIYTRIGLGFYDTYFIEGTLRRDRSSTLPIENNTFYYPSVSTSVLLSNIIGGDETLNFLKLRANYAEVGNATDPYRVFNTYQIFQPDTESVRVGAPFGGSGVASNNFTLNNLELKPERAKSYEVGLELDMLNRRVGLDASYYRTRTEDQITPVPVSNATGFGQVLLNAGTMENKGLELSLHLVPVQTEDFYWNMNINWSKNENTVISLADGIDNLVLADFQATTINATPGQPYGTIRGTDYVYDENGRRIVNSNGYYMITPNSNEIIGNVQPDWTGGFQNSLGYKNWSFEFLVDVQKGGDIFSLDTWYGFATGIYDITVGENDLGLPKRNPLSQGGGIILPGVDQNGNENTKRIAFNTAGNPYGYARDAQAGHVYDASFVKLREASLTYDFSKSILDVVPFTDGSISLIGRNLWIIHKNIPYSDPEAGLSAGNIQGHQSGAYPAFREIGASLRLNF